MMPVTFHSPLCLYTATELVVSRWRQNQANANQTQTKNNMDTPLSQSNVSLRLSLIRKECEKLMEEGQSELSLEEPSEATRPSSDSFNPYDRGE